MFEQPISIGKRFHYLVEATQNAQESMTVLHQGLTKKPIREDLRLRDGMYGETTA